MFFVLVYVCIMSAVWVSQCWTVCSCQEHDYVMLVPGLGWWHTYAGLGRWARAGHTTTASQQHNSNWPALSGPAISATTISVSSLGSSILAIPTFCSFSKRIPSYLFTILRGIIKTDASKHNLWICNAAKNCNLILYDVAKIAALVLIF